MVKFLNRICSNVLVLGLITVSPLLSAVALSDVSVEVQVEVHPESVEAGESVALDFVVSAPTDAIEVGEPQYTAPDFDEINSYNRGRSFMHMMVNGQVSQQVSERFTVILHPKKEGVLKIQKISIPVNGKPVSVPDQSVQVVSRGALPQRRLHSGTGNFFGMAPGGARSGALPRSGLAAPVGKAGQSVFLKTDLDQQKVFKGQMIKVGYWIYTRARLQGMHVERYPTADGFLKEDLENPWLKQQLQWESAVISGQEYKRALLAKYALFPVREGQLPLDVFSAKISFQGGAQNLGSLFGDEDDIFNLNAFFKAFQGVTEVKESDRRTVEVLPLPVEGRPASFSGLVGQFDVHVSADKSAMKVGEALTLTVTVSGEGHAGSLEKLALETTDAWDRYEEKSSTKFDPSGRSERTFEILLVAKKPGTQTLGPVEIAFFDPEKKLYMTKKSQELAVVVAGGDGSVVSPPASAQGPRSQMGEASRKGTSLGEPAGPLSEEDWNRLFNVTSSGSNPPFSFARGFAQWEQMRKVRWGWALIWLLAAGVWFVWWRWTLMRGSLLARSERERAEATERLRDLMKKGETAPSLGSLEQALVGYLKVCWQCDVASSTRDELRSVLLERGEDPDVVDRLLRLLERLDSMRYTPQGTGVDRVLWDQWKEQASWLMSQQPRSLATASRKFF